MTDYEVFGFISSRGQPRDDEELVSEAAVDDLDPALIDAHIERLIQSRPQADYLRRDREKALIRLRICGWDGEVVRPTNAGLLVFAKYPQEFFPQIRITFVRYYGVTEDEPAPGCTKASSSTPVMAD